MTIVNIGDCCLESVHYLPASCTVASTLQKPLPITKDTTILLTRRSNNTNTLCTAEQVSWSYLILNQQSTINDNTQLNIQTTSPQHLNMYPGGYGNYGGGYGGYGGGYGGYGGYGNAYGGGGGGCYGMNPYQSAQMQQANMRRAYAAQTQQANMHRAQQENTRRSQNQYARQQQTYSEQADRARAQQERYMRRAQAAQAEQGERNRESTQNAWMHRRQPRGRVDPESLQSKYRVLSLSKPRPPRTISQLPRSTSRDPGAPAGRKTSPTACAASGS